MRAKARMTRMRQVLMVVLVAIVGVFIFSSVALASEGGDLPWNTALEKFTKVLSGKTALLHNSEASILFKNVKSITNKLYKERR